MPETALRIGSTRTEICRRKMYGRCRTAALQRPNVCRFALDELEARAFAAGSGSQYGLDVFPSRVRAALYALGGNGSHQQHGAGANSQPQTRFELDSSRPSSE